MPPGRRCHNQDDPEMVNASAEEMGYRENDDRWLSLGLHDLRWTWGHLTLEGEVIPRVVMQGRVRE